MNDARNSPPGSDELGEFAGGEIVRQQGRKTARDHHGQRANDEQHAQCRDETWDGEGQSDKSVGESDRGGEQEAEQNRRKGRHAGNDQERGRHRRQRECRADRKVEFAADHQNRDADRDESDLGQQSENAAQIVAREKSACRARFEQRGKQDQQRDARQFRLFEIDSEQIPHDAPAALSLSGNCGGLWLPRDSPVFRFSGGPVWPNPSADRPVPA